MNKDMIDELHRDMDEAWNKSAAAQPQADLIRVRRRNTPASWYLNMANGCASQEWQDGFNYAVAFFGRLAKLALFLLLLVVVLVAVFTFSDWAPPVRLWLIQLSIDASVWLQS